MVNSGGELGELGELGEWASAVGDGVTCCERSSGAPGGLEAAAAAAALLVSLETGDDGGIAFFGTKKL